MKLLNMNALLYALDEVYLTLEELNQKNGDDVYPLSKLHEVTMHACAISDPGGQACTVCESRAAKNSDVE